MSVVGLCSLKGGTGKTTLAINLADRMFSAGFRVCLVDFDPLRTSASLASLCEGESRFPVVAGEVSASGASALDRLRDRGDYDFVLCDLPGADSMVLPRMLRNMDLVLSPCCFSRQDLMGAMSLVRGLEGFDIPLVIVPNRAPVFSSQMRDMQAGLATLGAEVCPVAVVSRIAHVYALENGTGVCSYRPDSQAAAEIQALWEWIGDRLGAVTPVGG